MKKELTETQERERGELLIETLQLRPDFPREVDADGWVKYSTKWGTKTALGLFRTVKRIVEEGK